MLDLSSVPYPRVRAMYGVEGKKVGKGAFFFAFLLSNSHLMSILRDFLHKLQTK